MQHSLNQVIGIVASIWISVFLYDCVSCSAEEYTETDARLSRQNQETKKTVKRKSKKQIDPELEKRLKRFQKYLSKKDITDDEVFAEIGKLNKTIQPKNVSQIVNFTIREKDKRTSGALQILLMDRGRLDEVAWMFAKGADLSNKNISYSIWKFWEYRYGERKDYMERSRKMGVAFLNAYSKGGLHEKKVVARIFSQDDSTAKLSLEEFKKKINFSGEKKKTKKKMSEFFSYIFDKSSSVSNSGVSSSSPSPISENR